MVTFKVGPDTFKIKFTHFNDDFLANQSSYRKGTICEIQNTSGDTLACGRAYLHHKDVFNKKVGRKTSFERALHKLTDDKSIRRDFWAEYFDKLDSDTNLSGDIVLLVDAKFWDALKESEN